MALGITARHPCVERFCGPRSVIGVSAVIVALVSVLALTSAQASGRNRDQEPCAWGASSVSAEMVDGKLVVSPVATTGCIP